VIIIKKILIKKSFSPATLSLEGRGLRRGA
jgi:hypothetical protein